MTRTLILIRHAKSSWDTPTLTDHDRPLNKRGVRSAKALGGWLNNRKWVPDQGIISSARRTQETWQGLGLTTKPEVTDRLYHASAGRMFDVLSQATGNVVLMLGHNPGIADFADQMAHTRPDHPRFVDYPSGATTVLRFDIDAWSDLSWSSGLVLDFVIPRELLGE